MSQVTYTAMLSDVSAYRRVRSRAVIQKLTPSETFVRIRQLGYDLFGMRDAMESCDIKESVDTES